MVITSKLNRTMGEFFHDWSELLTNPAPRLTKAGRAMLSEIWEASGKPAKPNDRMVAIADLGSFQHNANSAGHVLERLLSGGYLNVIEEHSLEEATYLHPDMHITQVELSERAFAVLIAMGYVV